jgi:hypothetical protein
MHVRCDSPPLSELPMYETQDCQSAEESEGAEFHQPSRSRYPVEQVFGRFPVNSMNQIVMAYIVADLALFCGVH